MSIAEKEIFAEIDVAALGIEFERFEVPVLGEVTDMFYAMSAG